MALRLLLSQSLARTAPIASASRSQVQSSLPRTLSRTAPAKRALSTTSYLCTESNVNNSRSSTHDNAQSTTSSIQIEHPPEQHMPSSKPVSSEESSSEHTRPTLPTFSLEGRTVVVTGGARGLGLVMAQACVVSGADVALIDLNEEECAKQASAITSSYQSAHSSSTRVPKISAHYADVSSEASVNSCLDSVLSQHGKIDHLITSAGFTENFPAETYPFNRVQKLWGVNVDGTYLFATGVARHLLSRKAKGSMVFVGSMSGSIVNVPQPQAPYNASKAAVRHLASSLAVEWAPAGIRVNCISPGYMLTALTKKILDEKPKLRDTWLGMIPSGEMGRPEDLMGAVVYLLSDAARYTTGADLRVDGGYSCA